MKNTATTAFLPRFPFFLVFQLHRCPLLALKMISLCPHSNSLLQLRISSAFYSQRHVSRCVPPHDFLIPAPFSHFWDIALSFFIPNSSIPHSKQLKLFLSWNNNNKIPLTTTQFTFTTQTFKESALMSPPLTLTTSLHFTPSLQSTFGLKVLS